MNIPIETLKETIQNEAGITAEALDKKIKQKLEELSGLISEQGAAHIIANELGVKLEEAPAAQLTISQLTAGMRNVELSGKIRSVYEVREFNTERRSGKVGNLLLQDESGITRLVLWNDKADELANLAVGDIIKVKNAYARENNGRVELHLGDNAKLVKNPEGVTVDVDVSEQVLDQTRQPKNSTNLTKTMQTSLSLQPSYNHLNHDSLQPVQNVTDE